MPFTPDGNWYEVRRTPTAHRPAIFLDRDGVIIEEKHYLKSPEGVCLIPGVADAVKNWQAAGFAVVLITNQSGIGRGLMSWDDFFCVQQRIEELWLEQSLMWDMVLACPSQPRPDRPENPWRKPSPGMIKFAASELNLSVTDSVLVGDKLSDLLAGAAAGVGRLFHVLTGHGTKELASVVSSGLQFTSISSAALLKDF